MSITGLNRDALLGCCGSVEWADRLLSRSPFLSYDQLFQGAEDVWWELEESDWLEAFSKHPQIGSLQPLPAWATEEQAGMSQANTIAHEAMRDLNRRYFERFGWIFIICATGKSAGEMRAAIEERLSNASSDEIRIAAAEQARITQIRLRKLLKV